MNALLELRQLFAVVTTAFGKGWKTHAEMMLAAHLQVLAVGVVEILLMEHQTHGREKSPTNHLQQHPRRYPNGSPQSGLFQNNAGKTGRSCRDLRVKGHRHCEIDRLTWQRDVWKGLAPSASTVRNIF